MLMWLFAGLCSLVIMCAVIPAARLFYYMIRDILWEKRNLPPKK